MSCFDYEYMVGNNLKKITLFQKIPNYDLKIVGFLNLVETISELNDMLNKCQQTQLMTDSRKLSKSREADAWEMKRISTCPSQKRKIFIHIIGLCCTVQSTM